MAVNDIAAGAQRQVRPGAGALGRAALLALGYALPALLIYASALPTFASTIPGGPTAQRDGWQNVWNLWWVAQALERGQSPLATTWLYYPEGIDLFWQTLNVTNGLLALPLTLLAGPVAAYNALALLSFVLAGLTMYLLARALGAGAAGAFVAGLLWSFSPIHVARLVDGQLEHLTIQWLPLYALLLVRALDNGRRWAAVGAGLLLVWIAFTSLYQALSGALLLGLYAAALLALAPSWQHARALAARAGLVAAAWLLPLSPWLVGAVGGAAPDDDWLDSQRLHSATPLDFVLPNPNHILWGAPVSRLGQALHPDAGSWNVALGTLAIALAGLALVRRAAWREPWPWVALGALVLALGPSLVLGGYDTGLPLPYALINLLPAARIGQRPNYLVLVALLALAPLAACAVDALLARFRRPALPMAALLLLLAVDLAPAPLPLTDAAVPEVFGELAADPTPGAVLELPFLPERSEPLRAQLVHERPILGGYVSRTPDYRWVVERPALQALWQRREPEELTTPGWADAMGSTLRHYGIRYIVVRWRDMPPDERARLSTLLASLRQGLLQQVYDFQGLGVYRLEYPGDPLPLAFTRGVYPAEESGGRRWQWMGESAELVLVNTDERARAVTLAWSAEAFRVERALTFALKRPNTAPTELARVAVPPAPTTRRLTLLLPPGETTLLLATSAEQAGSDDPRRLGVAFTRIDVGWFYR